MENIGNPNEPVISIENVELLFNAVWRNDLRTVTHLLELGLPVNIPNNRGETPLQVASAARSRQMVELLLDAGGNMYTHNSYGLNALHIAMIKGYKSIVDIFFERRADLRHPVKGTGEICLHIVAKHCNLVLTDTILNRGEDVNVQDKFGRTPLMLAVESISLPIVELLLNRGANINKTDYRQEAPLHLAANLWDCRMLNLLLDRGARINMRDLEGRTALHIAIQNEDMTMAHRLLERGALIDIMDNHGNTPLYYAVSRGLTRTVTKLLGRGAEVHVVIPIYRQLEHKRVKHLLWGHLLKLQLVGLVHKEDIPVHPMFRSEYVCWKQELINLKKVVVDNLSLFKVIHYCPNFECSLKDELLKYKRIQEVVNSPIFDERFKSLSFIIKLCVMKAQQRLILLRKAIVFFYLQEWTKKLPFRAKQNIMSNLSNSDLQNLIVLTENEY